MMFIAGVFGLPKLMDQNRTRIYMTYSLAVLVALDFDIVPYIYKYFVGIVIRLSGFFFMSFNKSRVS